MIRALKRLGNTGGGGAPPHGQAGRQGGRQGRGAAPGRGGRQIAPQNREAFERLTEMSSSLMSHGEYDVYTFTKEAFEKSAALLVPTARSTKAGAAAAPAFAALAGGDDDMFSDAPLPAAAARAAPVPASAVAAAVPTSSALDFGVWSVSQLKAFLAARSVPDSSAVEKRDLVAAAAAAAASAGLCCPEGYAFHKESGFFYSTATGMYFDLATGGFTQGGATPSWHFWDAAQGKFVPSS